MRQMFVVALATLLGLGTANRAMACGAAIPTYGSIGALYQAAGGSASHFGCPTTPEQNAAGPGRIQFFEWGAIAWSPNTGSHALQSAVIEGGRIRVSWQGMAAAGFFIVRIDRNGVNIDQQDVEPAQDRTSGSATVDISGDGFYRIVIAGCDRGGFLASSSCNGWSNPIELAVNRGTACPTYARQATRQVAEGARVTPSPHCTLAGGRWTPDAMTHAAWCRTAAWDALRSEADARAAEILLCIRGPRRCYPTAVANPAGGWMYTQVCNY